MNKYRFKVRDSDNRIIKGELSASSEPELLQILKNHQYLVVSYRIVKEQSFFKLVIRTKVNPLTIAKMCQSLSILIKAGMNIVKSLEIVNESTSDKYFKKIIKEIITLLKKGQMLSDILVKYPKVFPVLIVNMIKLAEAGGNLGETFAYLAEYYQKDTLLKQKIKGSLIYPIILSVMCLGIFAILMTVVVPQFGDAFISMNLEIPKMTQVIMNLSLFIRKNIIYLLIIILLLGLITYRAFQTKRGRVFKDWLKLKVPIVKKINSWSITTSFTRSFMMLCASGVLPSNAVKIVSNLLENQILVKRMRLVNAEINRGQTVSDALATLNYFPKMLIEMLAVGENAGNILSVLKVCTEYYDEQSRNGLSKLTSILEPILILMISIIVLLVMIAVLIPMMEIMNQVSGV